MNVVIDPVIWGAIGFLLIIADVVTTTFIMVFFGLGALITAVTTWLGLTPSISGQLVVFSLVSLVTMALFRKTAHKLFGKRKANEGYTEYVGEKATVTEKIPQGGEGRIRHRGTEWIAFSDAAGDIQAGAIVRIKQVDGIKLKVEFES